MRITHINGITRIMLDAVEELPAAMAMLPAGGEHHFEIEMPRLPVPMPTPPPAPMPEARMPEAEEFSIPSRSPRRGFPVHTIGTVYATPLAVEMLEMLKAHPEGLTTRQATLMRHRDELAAITDPAAREDEITRQVSNVSGYLINACKDYGLVRRIPRSLLWTVSEFGKIARIEVVAKPSCQNKHNKKLARYTHGLRTGEHE